MLCVQSSLHDYVLSVVLSAVLCLSAVLSIKLCLGAQFYLHVHVLGFVIPMCTILSVSYD